MINDPVGQLHLVLRHDPDKRWGHGKGVVVNIPNTTLSKR
jgi:hypothetical protein